MKYSTIEACFSVPMLNLTMPNFPFAIAFAASFLKWPAWCIGLMAALPHLCNFIQPPLSRFLERRYSHYRIMAWGFAFSATPWTILPISRELSLPAGPTFACVVAIATLANSIAAVAWSASISEVVPPRISGRFFGKRNLLFGFWTLVVVLTAGKIVDAFENSFAIFTTIFAAAGISRLCGLFFLTRMKFPPTVMQPQPVRSIFADLKEALQDRNYLLLILFIGVWGLLLNIGMPFYTVYLLNGLAFQVGDTVTLTTLSSLGGLLTLSSWGLLADRFGSKPVQYVAGLIWGVVGLLAWLFAGPERNAHLYLNYLIVGAATAGFQLCQFNLMVKLIPGSRKSPYIALFISLTSLMTALGPFIGGTLLAILPDVVGSFFGQPIRDFHMVFSLSFAGCLMTLPLLYLIRETQSQSVEDVLRNMRMMRSFNPFLSLPIVAELLLTPRGILSLTQNSIRAMRRQAKVLTEVGSELISGGEEAVKSTFKRKK